MASVLKNSAPLGRLFEGVAKQADRGFFKKNFFDVQLIYNIVLVSGVQIYTYYIYILHIYSFSESFRLYIIIRYQVVPHAIQ